MTFYKIAPCCLVFILAVVLVILFVWTPKSESQQKIIQRHTYYFTKTAPDGTKIPCITNEDLSVFSCKWENK